MSLFPLFVEVLTLMFIQFGGLDTLNDGDSFMYTNNDIRVIFTYNRANDEFGQWKVQGAIYDEENGQQVAWIFFFGDINDNQVVVNYVIDEARGVHTKLKTPLVFPLENQAPSELVISHTGSTLTHIMSDNFEFKGGMDYIETYADEGLEAVVTRKQRGKRRPLTLEKMRLSSSEMMFDLVVWRDY